MRPYSSYLLLKCVVSGAPVLGHTDTWDTYKTFAELQSEGESSQITNFTQSMGREREL